MKLTRNYGVKSFIKDESGQFSLWISIMAFPLVMATSLALDMKLAEGHRSNIQRSLDVAAIAIATNNSITDNQKVQLANRVFNDNYNGDLNVSLSVNIKEDRVTLDADTKMKSSMGAIIGRGNIEIKRDTTAMMDRRNTICVLALAENGRNRINFINRTDFDAPTCAVQANSSHANAMRSTSVITPAAKSFCSVGGAVGRYDPYVKGECRPIEDPYENVIAPQPGACVPSSIFRVPGPFFSLIGVRTSLLAMTGRLKRLRGTYGNALLEVNVSENIAKQNAVLKPGTYCGGLTVQTPNVTFLPGTYIMKDGPLTFRFGADAIADDVTFVMHGRDAVVTIERGAELWLKAPKEGPMAGMAFFQDARSTPQGSPKPDGLHLISSGGKLDVLGTMYFPTQALDISGNSSIGAQSPATSFIAYEVTFAGQTKATIGVDHVAAGLPQMLPQADDGARLLK